MAFFRQERFIDTEETLTRFPDPNVTFTTSHLDIQAVLKLLKTERQSSALFNFVWQKAEFEYRFKKTALKDKSWVAMPDECHIAVIAYALDTSYMGKMLYQDFNARCSKLTNGASWDAFPYKSMYWLLMQSVQGVNSKPSINSQVYRRASFHYSKAKFSIGQEVCFKQFTSCSSNSKVHNSHPAGAKRTILEFCTGARSAIGIDDYSGQPNSEVVIFPWTAFRIVSWQVDFLTHKIVLESK